MLVNHKTTPDFAPPHWLFSLRDDGESMFGYSRRELESGQGGRSALFGKTGEEGPQVARLGRLTAIFDGLLYDAAKLARELGVADGAGSDAELLLECYRAHGESFFPRLRGTFAFVLRDAENGVLHCVRDPMGYYPCFFARPGGNLLISTSAQAILDHPEVSRAVDRLVLLDYFFDVWGRREETFYASIKRVSPGHALRVRDGDVTHYRYWNPLPSGSRDPFLKEDELGRFEQLLARSVDRCLEYGPSGIFLSGGLDSVSVAALASQSCQAAGSEPPFALSLVFPYPEYNEEAVQSSVARQLGMPQELLPLENGCAPGGLFQAGSELSRQLCFPLQNIWIPAYSHLTLLAKQRGVRTILTGGGGDEWLGVTPVLAADLIRNFRLGELGTLWRSSARSYDVEKLPLTRSLLWNQGLRPLLRENAGRLLHRTAPEAFRAMVRKRRAKKKPPWVKVEPQLWREFLHRLEAPDTEFKPLEGPFGYYFGDGLRSLNHPIVSWEMEENFDNGRRLGVRLVHPYLDADLVEMLCAVPPESLMRGDTSKGMVRDVLARRFPDLGFERQKKIVVRRTLPQSVMGDPVRLWRENGKAEALPALGLADADQLDAYLTGALKSENHRDTFRAWQVITTEHWLRARQ